MFGSGAGIITMFTARTWGEATATVQSIAFWTDALEAFPWLQKLPAWVSAFLGADREVHLSYSYTF